MLIIFPKKESSMPIAQKPADWAFMENSEKILNDIPNTWKQYPDTEAGSVGIIDMEYGELKRATTVSELKQELEHLASACLHFWRKLSNVK